mmetsp:Transcript_14114/g.20675  ORF Transcript_14114/g.20675 Transcript_14114/m.20675 type:complete len:228 (-) Transcript_14114:146-829(-)|eukprot:CAMPEP_0194049688 /NCGR_PEP_ID=MMETSP0009_2-20130614/30835_1 /TAXON_ID=210454 /ORGANISM="Grammatophora oceanica, Strain CCMP 410" /LENGTH=227 /DNA_ID=CAMNT_0038695899 /DNA_START=86 /DNA_END=769 /DNA_ORIENTATION=+
MTLVVSGSADDVGTMNASNKAIPFDTETMRIHVGSVFHRLSERVSLESLRPLTLFLGLTGPSFCLAPDAFTPPSQKLDKTVLEKLQARVTLNFAFFLTNYAVVAAGCAIVVALMNPGMLFFLGIVYGAWWLHEYLIHNEIDFFGYNFSRLLSISQRSTILTVLTMLVLSFKCLVPLLSFLAVSGFIILTHAVLRDPTQIESTGPTFNDESDGESSGEEVLVERGDVI